MRRWITSTPGSSSRSRQRLAGRAAFAYMWCYLSLAHWATSAGSKYPSTCASCRIVCRAARAARAYALAASQSVALHRRHGGTHWAMVRPRRERAQLPRGSLSYRMLQKILIANRGEIACRVARTARRMGIRCVAVYSDADTQAMHVRACDEAYRVGAAPANESYLRGDAIIAVAKACGAQAIHPGYGFLSENAEFAAAVGAAGLVFIGPPPAAIRAMGSKSEAKIIMEKAGVPLVPGYSGDDQSPDLLAKEAARIGFPVLIKASAGGGGKGMRVVEEAAKFADQLAGAKR